MLKSLLEGLQEIYDTHGDMPVLLDCKELLSFQTARHSACIMSERLMTTTGFNKAAVIGDYDFVDITDKKLNH